MKSLLKSFISSRPSAAVVKNLFLIALFSAGEIQTWADSNPALPKTVPPPATLAFPSNPKPEDFFRARVFEEPMVAIGAEPGPEENAALASALVGYAKRSGPDDFTSLTKFLEAHPKSPWRAAVLTGLGTEYYNTAHYSLALAAWAEAWDWTKNATDPKGKAVADHAAGELAYMYARLGRMDELDPLLKSVEGRMFVGPATEKISGAREGLWNMQNRPEISFRCGPLALHRIKRMSGAQSEADTIIFNSASTQKGFSLVQVAELSKQLGLNYQMAFRQKHGEFVVPSVVHWKVGHYAAMVRQEGDNHLLEDPTFGNTVWATRAALEAETSGYFLIPPGPLPKGWRTVETKEGETIWGKGFTSNNDPRNTGPGDPGTGQCSGGGGGGGVPIPYPNGGMAASRVHLMLVNLNLVDTPVGYSPPVGPAVGFTMRYSHREAYQPGTFTYSNFGPKWTCDWISYITDNAQSPLADVNHYVQGGGTRTYTGFNTNTQVFAYQQYDQTRLTRIATSPISYEMLSGDGSKLIFSQSDGSVGTSRKIFLTQIIDPFTNAVTLFYDASMRLTNITDAIGQVTTLSYSNVTDTTKITRATDPFGRFATFAYDSSGRLTNITDVIGMTSRFSYESSGDFINALTTPYGTTSFTRGGGGTTRWLETFYPDGSKDRVEFNQSTGLGVPDSDAASSVPQGMGTGNAYLYARNTYYWNRTACATGYGDYTKAKIYHWLHTVDVTTCSGILESTKEALEGRVWYDYDGQSSSLSVGSIDRPKHVGRVLDDGFTQLYTYGYNGFGNLTNTIDPLGRTLSYIYSTNEIDLLEVRMTRAGQNQLMSKATYNAQHRPLTTTDAAGQTTTNTYNARGQLLTTSNPKGEVTTYNYNPNGYLIAVDGPLPGTNDTSAASYDTLGRMQTRTDASGYSLTFNHDALDRLTNVTFPDSTFYKVTYQHLDPAILKDRAGRQTFLDYTPLRELAKRTDPLGRITRFQWCSCGALKSLTDPMGRTTEWETDVQGRPVAKLYGDGSKISYFYENTSGRLRETVDEKLQVKRFTHNRDNTLRAVSYLNTALPTPSVTYAYDPDYKRRISMVDGLGITAYNYVPISATPTLGAGKLASEDGPYTNDTITYSYDELGRPLSVAVDGVATSLIYDPEGRVVSETNALGGFSYGFDGNSPRMLWEAFPNGLTRTNTYGNNLQDMSLVAIDYRIGATAISGFDYIRDIPATRITSWSQRAGASAPDVYNFSYDAADRLVSTMVTNSGLLLNSFAYAYDAADNRTLEVANGATNSTTHNALNQISTTTASRFGSTNEWDGEGRLVAVNTGNQRSELAYDGLGRLASLRQFTNGLEVSSRRLLWCGNKVCEERDAAGSLSKRFFEQGMKITAGTNVGSYFYTKDHLGSVREVTDGGGAVRARYRYDSFGRRNRTSGDIEADFGFIGAFWSKEAGLAVTRYRTYDPGLGRWLSRDPLRNAEARQGFNLYSYAQNNPINNVDRLGLCCEREKQALEDVLELVQRLCKGFDYAADKECELAHQNGVDPNDRTCRNAQANVQGFCDTTWQKYSSTIASLAANYFTCLGIGCWKPPCFQDLGEGQDEHGCFADGSCNAPGGKPAERSAAGSQHNDMY